MMRYGRNRQGMPEKALAFILDAIYSRNSSNSFIFNSDCNFQVSIDNIIAFIGNVCIDLFRDVCISMFASQDKR